MPGDIVTFDNQPEQPAIPLPSPDEASLQQPSLYLNRYLNLLEFNYRVLQFAKDPGFPLLERLKHLCISGSNLNEVFEIRIAALKQRAWSGATTGPDGTTLGEILNILTDKARSFVDEQYRILNEELFPALAAQEILFLKRAEWSSAQEQWLLDLFRKQLTPILSPPGMDPAHPFPKVLNKSHNFIVSLEGKDAFGRTSTLAVIQAPRVLPRIIQLPESITDGRKHVFVFLPSIIHAYVDELFPGMKSTGSYRFRVIRNSDLFVDEEEIEDLARALEGELSSRHYGNTVRLEVADNCQEDVRNYLLKRTGLQQAAIHTCNPEMTSRSMHRKRYWNCWPKPSRNYTRDNAWDTNKAPAISHSC